MFKEWRKRLLRYHFYITAIFKTSKGGVPINILV